MKITKINIIEGHGPDYIFLETDLPNGEYPFTGTAILKLSVAKGTAHKYVDENLISLLNRGR